MADRSSELDLINWSARHRRTRWSRSCLFITVFAKFSLIYAFLLICFFFLFFFFRQIFEAISRPFYTKYSTNVFSKAAKQMNVRNMKKVKKLGKKEKKTSKF